MANGSFDPTLAAQLVQLCELTYVQYAQGLKGGDGSITPPPGYQQTASFTAPEIDLTRGSSQMAAALAPHFDVTDPAARQALAVGLRTVFFGFTLQPSPGTAGGYNVVALRGTQSIQEWIEDATIVQIPVPLVWYKDGKFQEAKANLGFVVIFGFLVDQILSAVNAFANPNLPLYVTGHSLGGALAALAAPAINFLSSGYFGAGLVNRLQMSSFAGPRPGDPIYADAYNFFVPATFRVVNLCDVVPILPPTALAGYQYAQVGGAGAEWSYLFQANNVAANHGILNNYIPAVNAAVETNAPRQYPNSGVPG
ncbi:MAG TPA: lipase family protein [Thermoanaerobaculia bacterium]|nr:lipase family protein [Thermoanaerobaculia bacterium]